MRRVPVADEMVKRGAGRETVREIEVGAESAFYSWPMGLSLSLPPPSIPAAHLSQTREMQAGRADLQVNSVTVQCPKFWQRQPSAAKQNFVKVVASHSSGTL